MKTITVDKQGLITRVVGKATAGKTTYLLGVAYRLTYSGRKVLWLNSNTEIEPCDIATVVDCYHINQLEHILLQNKAVDAIILDDMHQVTTSPNRLSAEVLAAFSKDIPADQERFFSIQLYLELIKTS